MILISPWWRSNRNPEVDTASGAAPKSPSVVPSAGDSSASDVDHGNPIMNPDGSAAANDEYFDTSNDTPKDYDFMEYLEGLIASQGAENEINRQYNSAENALNRQFQSHEAQIQRQWYENMSNTAYQRSVADMKAAGINPILAYQNGGAASSGTGIPSGSAASYTATGGDTLSSILSSLADLLTGLSNSGSSLSRIGRILNKLK